MNNKNTKNNSSFSIFTLSRIIIFITTFNVSSSFTIHNTPITTHRKSARLYMTSSNYNDNTSSTPLTSSSRRQLIHQFLAVTAMTSSSFIQPANAASKSKEPITQQTVKSTFQSIRDELTSPNGGISKLSSFVDAADYTSILEFTKSYDLEFRKAKMVKARKFITVKEDKDKGLFYSNSVTFDLIGMNKNSRKGQEDIEGVKKYFGELKSDIENFLELEKNIDFSVYDE